MSELAMALSPARRCLDDAARKHAVAARIAVRQKGEDEWIDTHASGSLRKAHRIGFASRKMYLHERTAHEWGWGFECAPSGNLLAGTPLMEGDCPPLTEAAWHIERYLTLGLFGGDEMVASYLQITEADGKKREGVGLLLTKSSAEWLPERHAVFAIIAPFDPLTGRYLPAQNPF